LNFKRKTYKLQKMAASKPA